MQLTKLLVCSYPLSNISQFVLIYISFQPKWVELLVVCVVISLTLNILLKQNHLEETKHVRFKSKRLGHGHI